MKKLCLVVLIGGLSLFLLMGNAVAIPVAEPLVAFPVSALTDFGVLQSSTLIGQFILEPNLHNLVASACYYDTGELVYTYLYQVYSNGPASTRSFSLDPFIGLTSTTAAATTGRMGYVSSSALTMLPASYNGWSIESPSKIPTSADYDAPVKTAGFSFPPNYIVPDSTSHILVIASIYEPGMINGNVIDGGVSRQGVIGPVPEPSSMLLLGMGLFGLGGVARRKRFPA